MLLGLRYRAYEELMCVSVFLHTCGHMFVRAFRAADHQARGIQLNLTNFITGIMGNLATKDAFGPSGNYNSSKKLLMQMSAHITQQLVIQHITTR